MGEQPRWPRGTPVAPSGHGPGGGRWRDDGAAAALQIHGATWVTRLTERLGFPGQSGYARRIERLLEYGRRGDYRIVGTSSGSSAEVEFRQFPDGTTIAYKRFSPGEGKMFANREEWTAAVADAVGAPTAAAVVDPDWGSAVLMEYVDGGHMREQGLDAQRARKKQLESPSGHRLALLDLLVRNKDRHPGNWIATDDGPVGIDHGYTMFGRQFEVARGPDYEAPTPTTEILVNSDFEHLIVRANRKPDGKLGNPPYIQVYYSRDELEQLRTRIRDLEVEGRIPDHIRRGLLETLDVLIAMTIDNPPPAPVVVGGRKIEIIR